MIDLNKITSLNLKYDEKKQRLLYGPILYQKQISPLIRTIDDLKGILIDHNWLKKADGSKAIYLIFRDMANYSDVKPIVTNDWRFDIIVLLPARLGREYPKTTGHYNSQVQNIPLTHPELHQVLEGEAIFLLQKTEEGEVKDAYLIRAKKGEIILMPPNYTRCIINPIDKALIVASWNVRSSLPKFEKIIERKGMCHYVVEGKTIANENYKNVPVELTTKKPENPEKFGLKEGQPIYRMIDHPERLEFLAHPEKHAELFNS